MMRLCRYSCFDLQTGTGRSESFPPELTLDQYERRDVRGKFAGPVDAFRKFSELEHIAAWWALPNFRAGRNRPLPVNPREQHGGLVQTVRVRVTSQTDDAEEFLNTGGVYIDSSDLELGYDGLGSKTAAEQIVGMRFASVPVPPSSMIFRSWLELHVDEKDDSSPAHFTICAEVAANAKPFSKDSKYFQLLKVTK